MFYSENTELLQLHISQIENIEELFSLYIKYQVFGETNEILTSIEERLCNLEYPMTDYKTYINKLPIHMKIKLLCIAASSNNEENIEYMLNEVKYDPNELKSFYKSNSISKTLIQASLVGSAGLSPYFIENFFLNVEDSSARFLILTLGALNSADESVMTWDVIIKSLKISSILCRQKDTKQTTKIKEKCIENEINKHFCIENQKIPLVCNDLISANGEIDHMLSAVANRDPDGMFVLTVCNSGYGSGERVYKRYRCKTAEELSEKLVLLKKYRTTKTKKGNMSEFYEIIGGKDDDYGNHIKRKKQMSMFNCTVASHDAFVKLILHYMYNDEIKTKKGMRAYFQEKFKYAEQRLCSEIRKDDVDINTLNEEKTENILKILNTAIENKFNPKVKKDYLKIAKMIEDFERKWEFLKEDNNLIEGEVERIRQIVATKEKNKNNVKKSGITENERTNNQEAMGRFLCLRDLCKCLFKY